MIVCDYLTFALVLRSSSVTGKRRGPVLTPAYLRARQPWSALEGFPDDFHYCEDVGLSLGRVLTYDMFVIISCLSCF